MNINDMVSYKAVVVDGNNLAWRWMKNPFLNWSYNGRKTGVIHGVLTSLFALKKRYKVRQIFVCWDDVINKRTDKSETYKANRKEGRYSGSNELGKQIETLHNNLCRFGVQSLKTEGYEADDLCYTVSKKLANTLDRSERILLVSRDHDYRQIVDLVGSDKVYLLVPGSGAKDGTLIYEPLGYNFIVYHALTGDSADNIKGIPRFKKDKAMELASKYDSVDSLLDNESDEKISKFSELLKENASLLSFIEDRSIIIRLPKTDNEALKEFCEVFGLKKFYKTNFGTERQAEMFGGVA